MRFKNSFINRLVFKYELAMWYTRFLTFLYFINVKFLTLTCNKKYVFVSFGE